MACFAGISAILSEKRDEVRAADIAVALIFLVLVSLPIFPISWIAVSGLSLYILLFTNVGSERRRKCRRKHGTSLEIRQSPGIVVISNLYGTYRFAPFLR
jgi:hypothetical protein